jgi:hypothetical protein
VDSCDVEQSPAAGCYELGNFNLQIDDLLLFSVSLLAQKLSTLIKKFCCFPWSLRENSGILISIRT